jgi:hypothetical protein
MQKCLCGMNEKEESLGVKVFLNLLTIQERPSAKKLLAYEKEVMTLPKQPRQLSSFADTRS